MNRSYRAIGLPGCAPAPAVVLLLLTAFSGRVFAQAVNAGEIRGTVTDTSGAVIPDVSVTIHDTLTGVTTRVVTNGVGIYDTPPTVPGNYTLTFSKEGFNRLVRSGVDLGIEIITVDAQLSVGTATQEVDVSAEASLLRTETAEQGETLQDNSIMELPHLGQTWTYFNQALPGVTGTGEGISVNGEQPYQQNFLADGGTGTLPRSNNQDMFVIFESVAEVEVSTANFNAQYGSGSAVFNQILKSGTNQFHGSAYEYLQNNILNARSMNQVTIPISRWNMYGGTIGGPARKNKLFFFLNIESNSQASATFGYTTYPTQAMRQGNFSYPGFMNRSDGTPRLIYDPNSLVNGKRTAFPNNIIPASELDPLALKLQSYLPLPNTTPGVMDNTYYPLPAQAGVVYNNYYYSRRGLQHPTTYLWKVDYALSGSNRLGASMARQNNTQAYQPSFSELYPMQGQNHTWYDETGQVTDVWTISQSIVNEFRGAMVREYSVYVPTSMNKGYMQALGINYGLADTFPGLTIGGPIGGVSITPGQHITSAMATFAPSDTMTIIHGKHIFKFGGLAERNSDNGGAWGDLISASYSFDSNFTSQVPGNTTESGLGYASFLTGQVSGWSALHSTPISLRIRVAQFFVQDDYKIRPNLTLNLGLRYEIQGGWSEKYNRIGDFDPTLMNPVTNTLGAMWFAGQDGRTNLEANVYDTFLPRFGFAWTPRSKWSVRGGFGMYSHKWDMDQEGQNAQSNPNGFFTIGSMNQTDNIHPVFVLSNPNPPLNLYVPNAAERTPGSLNGQAVAYYPYHMPTAKVYQWSIGLQRQLWQDVVAEVSYVGNHAADLAFDADFNQVPQALLGPGNAQLNRPYPQFQGISGVSWNNISNYDALQAVLRKRFTKGLSVNANYSFSKNLNDCDSNGHQGSCTVYQSSYNVASNYGISTNDIPQMFKVLFVYQLPVGKGQTFLSHGALLDAVFGGWQASGIFMKQSGLVYMPTVGTGNNSGALAGTWYPNRIGSGQLSNPSMQEYFDLSAFTVPATYTFGDSGRDILRGPGTTTLDFSMGKSFSISKLREGMRVQLRMDATNVLNHPCWANPNSALGTSGVGTITASSVAGRNLQVGARLSF